MPRQDYTMIDKQQIKEFLTKEMKRLDYDPKSITLYLSWINRLKDFYPNKSLDKITLEDIKAFIDHNVSKAKVSASAINVAFHASILLYNKIWGKNYDFTKIQRPKKERAYVEVLTEKEIIELIETISNLKHKAIIALTYSAGLDISEVRNLKPADVELKKNIIKVRGKSGKLRREAILAKYAKTLIEEHLKANSPTKYLFEGYRPGMQYSTRSMQEIFNQGLIKANISKKLTFKALKYSYVIHLENLGVSLRTVLMTLGLKSSQSLEFFSEISSRGENKLTFSPLDKIFNKESIEYPINVEFLEKSIQLVRSKDERDYLNEALVCMNSGSLRAGIIFVWNAAILNIRQKCFNHGKRTLNQSIIKYEQNAKTVSKLDDFAYIKDSTMLLVFQDLGHVDKGEKDSLVDCLDLRNKCGHPGQYRPKPLKAMSYLEELLTIVFKK